MCLVAFALDQSSRFPFVVAANRDEFFDRPAARLGWWEPAPGELPILGGRDLQAGGTWLGLTAQGRLGLVTNVRNPASTDNLAPSRGDIVPRWLRGDLPMYRLWPQLALHGYNGFNLLALDFAQGECYWANNNQPMPIRLEKGIFGISNAELDTPWPKLQQLKAEMKVAVSGSTDAEQLAMSLFEALSDSTTYPDEELPSTGVPKDWERLLSSAFIKSPDGKYGTRCSTVIVSERVNKRLVTHVLERTYSPQSTVALLRRVTLKNWPPRYTADAMELARLNATLPPPNLHAVGSDDRFESSDVSEHDNHDLPEGAVSRRSRARNLIKLGAGSTRICRVA
ncbi:MAG TPA: NRDE family protein [Aquabacterium sp.]|nr:NRDE family protein [Aquabacterium sp.]